MTWSGPACARLARRWNGRSAKWEIDTGRVAKLKAQREPILLMTYCTLPRVVNPLTTARYSHVSQSHTVIDQ